MTENNRIILNTLATYGRSVYALALGLFSTRWILAALGESDFGLFGVVGSVIVVIGFLNGLLGGAVGRYYAFAIGEARNLSEAEAREHLMRWFNAAVSIHFVLATILCAAGYPVGIYAIHHWLVIPDGRIVACEIVFSLSLVLAFLNMISVPYISMYRAKQLITELSFWGIVQTTAIFLCAIALLHASCDRLVLYAAMMTIIPGTVVLIQMYRARRSFGVCCMRRSYLFDKGYLSKLISFAVWEFFSCAGDMVRSQGTAFLVNRNFGTTVNAAWTVSSQVSNQTTSLSAAMIGALTPALTTAAGAGDSGRMNRLTFATCKFGTLLILVFSIPLILEMDEVLRLWLVTPPPYSSVLCRCMLLALVCHKLGWGHHMAILADGRVASLQVSLGVISASTIILVWYFIHVGYGALGIGLSFVISYSFLTLARVFFARKILGMSCRKWLAEILVPILVVSFASYVVGLGVVKFMHCGLIRIILTTCASLIVMVLGAWFVVLNRSEQGIIINTLGRMLKIDSFRANNGQDTTEFQS